MYGAPLHKIYAPPPLPKRKSIDGDRFYNGRYLITDPSFDPEGFKFPKPEVKAG